MTGQVGDVARSRASAEGETRISDTAEIVASWGLFLTLPVERVLTIDVGGFTVRPAYLFIGALLVLNAHRIPRSGVAGVVGAGLAFAIGASALTSLDPKQTAGYAVWGLFTILFFVAMVGRLRERRDLLEAWMRAYVATAGLWGLVTVLHSLLSLGFHGLAYSFVGDLPRVQALAYEPSFLAFYLVPAFYLSFATFQHFSMAATLLGVVASTSRAGLVGLAVGGVVLLLLERRAVVKRLVICGIGAACAGVVEWVLSNGSYGGFLSTTVTTVTRDKEDPASITPRLASWSDAWNVFLQHPVNGVGTGAYGGGVHELGIAVDVPASEIKTANLWFEVLAELGVIGFAALVALVLIGVYGLWRRRRDPIAPVLIAAIVASAAMFAFVQTLWVPYRWIVWIFAFSVAFPVVVGPMRGQASKRVSESPFISASDAHHASRTGA